MAAQVEHRRWARGIVAGYAKDGVRADREVQVCVSADGLAVDFYCSAAEARDYAAALIAVADACDEARAGTKNVPPECSVCRRCHGREVEHASE